MAASPVTSNFGDRNDWIVTSVNAFGLAISASAGLLVSVVLANGAGATAVGQFNQLAAIYIVASQFAALGVHLSVLHFLPIANPDEIRSAAHAGLLAVAPPALITMAAVWTLAAWIETLLDSFGLSTGIKLVAIGAGLFGINKLLLSFLNVLGHLIWLAAAQALRPVVWLVSSVLLLDDGGVSIWGLGAMFVFSELAVGTLALFRLTPFLVGRSAGIKPWLLRHLRFGIRAFPSNAITELNTRIDVLILGAYASDKVVGIYSFAALIAEGVFQIGAFLRTTINNRLVTIVTNRDSGALNTLTRSVGRVSLALTMLAGVAAFTLVPIIIDFFRLDPSLHEGKWVLAMLLVAVALSSPYTPFWNILMLGGHPGQHSVLMLTILAFNLVLNVIAVPIAGMTGAGIATSAMFLVFPFLLRFSSNHSLGMKLGGLR